MKPILAIFFFFASTAPAADISMFDVQLGRIASATSPDQRQNAVDTLLGGSQNIATAVVIRVLPKLDPKGGTVAQVMEQNLTTVVRKYRSLRNDTQTGASSGSAGSTTLVLNPYLADIFGVSFESGAILKTVSGQTINFQIKPAGLFCGTKDGNGSRAAPGTGCLDFWKRVGLTTSFDKGRSDAPSQLVALRDDFSELRIHFDLLQPTVRRATKAMMAQMDASSANATEIAALFDSNPMLKDWSADTRKSLLVTPLDRAGIDKAWDAALDKAAALFQSVPELNKALNTTIVPFANTNIAANQAAVRVDQLERTSLAAEYSWNRPDVAMADIANGIVKAGQRPPDLSTFRVVYARNYQPLVLAANAQMSWFNESLPGLKGQFRDWQVSGSATFLLKEIPNFGKTTLTFAGLIGELHNQPLGFDYTVPLVNDPTKTQKIDLTGPFRAFNAKLEFPTANKSVTIPFSFTYANRTDLNKETDVRGSFGMTIRFDSLFPTK